MPVLTFAPHIDRLRGAITGNLADGLVYFDIGNGVARARRNLIPVQPNTALQSIRRNAMARISSTFAGLSSANIETWQNFVADPRMPMETGRLGVPRKLTGRELFTRWNANNMAYLGAATILDVCPSADAIFSDQEGGAPANTVTAISAKKTTTPAGLEIEVSTIPAAFDYKLGVRITRQFSRAARKPRRVDLFVPGNGGVGYESVISVGAEDPGGTKAIAVADLPDDFGTITTGWYLGIELLPLNAGGGYSGKPSFFSQVEIVPEP